MKKGLLKKFSVIMLLLVTLFSFSIKSDAASFQYKDFNWDEFSRENNSYWSSFCVNDSSEDCRDRFLETSKRFYIRLYELLAEMQKKDKFIDDNFIIATVFWGLDIESFKDPVEGEDNPFNLDDSDSSSTKNNYIGFADKEAISYFEQEKDSLKTLINNFIGYRSTCYGISNEAPQTYVDANGNSYSECSSSEFDVRDGKCIDIIDTYNGTFFDSLGLTFIGSGNKKKCEDKANELGYSSYDFYVSATEEVNEEFYWDFLENSEYFDNKDHLQHYFAHICNKVGKKHMNELEPEEKEENKEDIIDVRKRIIHNIKDVLKGYENISEQYNSVSQDKYWWPIGSDSVNDVDGLLFANDEPNYVQVSSNFGMRTNPVSGEVNTKHSGIDIPGELGITNVIAAKDGVIAFSTLTNGISCPDGSDLSCGGKYGNYVIIQHVDGNYTLYAHLAKDSITVNVGDSVKKGQVIGKVGNSGSSTGPHLHFEVRVGGNDYSATQDPLNYISAINTRPVGASSQALEWIAAMEGTGPVSGDNYKVYADSGGVLTVGHGITLKYNADAFRAHGINPSSLSVGSLVPKSIVDSIYYNDLDGRMDNIRGMLSTKGVTLNENQMYALASLYFNCGNINGFFDNYQRYGSSEALCSNWWEEKALHDAKGNYLSGLKKRRVAECDLFVNGIYNMNVYG